MRTFVFTRNFYPLFFTQFLGAANDNFLKAALAMLLTYQLTSDESAAGMLTNLAAGLFILPFFLFSALAGQLADKYDPRKYVLVVKKIEVLLMILAAVAFQFHWSGFLFLLLFCMGAQSAFFGPVKYSLLPSLLKADELLQGNSWFGGGTYLAILSGVMAGGIVLGLPGGEYICGAGLILLALLGVGFAGLIPETPPGMPELKLDWNIFRQAWKILAKDVGEQKTVLKCVISASVFWYLGSMYLAQIPVFVKHFLGGSELISTSLYVLFSVGVGLGAIVVSLYYGKYTGIKKLTVLSPVICIFPTLDLAYMCWTLPLMSELRPDGEVLQSGLFYRTALDVCLVSIFGGIWSVPLQCRMQNASRREVLARVIAGNNIVNAFAMTIGAIGGMVLMKLGAGSGMVFLLTALFLLPVAWYMRSLLTDGDGRLGHEVATELLEEK